MNKFFVIEPEVAGGLGPTTEFASLNDRRVVQHLEYRFDGWLGDALLETTPCFIVTSTAAEALAAARLTGFHLDDVRVTKSELFAELYPDRLLPEFVWLKPDGVVGVDDFAIDDRLMLIVSNRAHQLLRVYGIEHAEVTSFG